MSALTIFSVNEVTLVGRVGDVKQADNSMLKFSLGTTEQTLNKETNQYKDYTTWHTVKVFNPKSHLIDGVTIRKGDLVMVTGKIENTTYNDKFYSSVIANTIMPISSSVEKRKKNGAVANQQPQQIPQQQPQQQFVPPQQPIVPDMQNVPSYNNGYVGNTQNNGGYNAYGGNNNGYNGY